MTHFSASYGRCIAVPSRHRLLLLQIVFCAIFPRSLATYSYVSVIVRQESVGITADPVHRHPLASCDPFYFMLAYSYLFVSLLIYATRLGFWCSSAALSFASNSKICLSAIFHSYNLQSKGE